ncbi:MAG: hypothetical protein QOJ57_2230, partial [Thermoleophilaceae bacterium]|nr:hypothetical protein [Thermoleophilaceae bacterium]
MAPAAPATAPRRSAPAEPERRRSRTPAERAERN